MRFSPLLTVALLLSIAPNSMAADIELMLVDGDQQARFSFDVSINGQPLSSNWNKTFELLLRYHDRNGNGTLDQREAAELPSAFALRQIAWGQPAYYATSAPKWSELSSDDMREIDAKKLGDYYRSQGVGIPLVGIGLPPFTSTLTSAIVKRIDTDNDGRVSKDELEACADVLGALDADGNELIGPGEIAAKVVYPGATGSILLNRFSGDRTSPETENFPVVVLPVDRANQNNAEEIAARKISFNLAWDPTAHRKETSEPSTTQTNIPRRAERNFWRTERGEFELIRSDGKLSYDMATVRKRLEEQFAEADADDNHLVDLAELHRVNVLNLRQLFPLADRSGDERLSNDELTQWLALQEQIASGHVLITVLDYGHGLFELLDANYDGSLSRRELMTAADRVARSGVMKDGYLTISQLPRQVKLLVSFGHPQSPLANSASAAPRWFQAMDRNADGDISPREFLGDVSLFRRFDKNNDGLLDLEEARAATSDAAVP